MLTSIRRILIWTFTLGAVSFSLGFFGPMILTPGANQGPLLGILITGPLGVVIGLAVGLYREYLGYSAGPRAVLLSWSKRGSSETVSMLMRSAAVLAGGFLAVYGMGALQRGEGRGAAAMLVVAAAIIYYGFTGRKPSWFLR